MENSLQKRIRSRAIIFKGDSIVAMYRENGGRKYYTFPGGGVEGDETLKQCVTREVFEEFGLVVEPTKKVYIYENERSVEHFYVCNWLSGNIGDGKGEEFDANRNNGLYVQTSIKIADIESLPLMPPEVAKALSKDYAKSGEFLRANPVKIVGTLKT